MNESDLTIESADTTAEQSARTDISSPAKKKFVAPEISVPVDVLESTTFFQFTDSGVTNP